MYVTYTVSIAQQDELKKVKKKLKKTQILLDSFQPFIIVVFIECDPKVKKEMKEQENLMAKQEILERKVQKKIIKKIYVCISFINKDLAVWTKKNLKKV